VSALGSHLLVEDILDIVGAIGVVSQGLFHGIDERRRTIFIHEVQQSFDGFFEGVRTGAETLHIGFGFLAQTEQDGHLVGKPVLVEVFAGSLAMFGQFDPLAPLPGSLMGGYLFPFEVEANGPRVSFGGHVFANEPWRSGVGIAIKVNAKIRVHPDLGSVATVREELRQRPHMFSFETIDGPFAGSSMDPHIGDGIPPVNGLILDVKEILEPPQGPETVSEVVDSSFLDFSLLMGLPRMAGEGGQLKRAKKGEEGFVVADKRAISLDDSGEHIVVHQLPGCSTKEMEGIEKTAMKGLLTLGMGELEVKQAAVALDNGHAVELPFGFAVFQSAEVSPVNLKLLSRAGFKADERTSVLMLLTDRLQVLVQNGLAALKAERSKALTNHLAADRGIHIEHPADFLFERVNLAGSLYGGFARVGILKIFEDGLSSDLKVSGDGSQGEPQPFHAMDFEDGPLLDHGLPPKALAKKSRIAAGSSLFQSAWGLWSS